MRWIWSTTHPSGAVEVIDDWVLWRLWRRNLRPMREFAEGDEVWLRHGRGASATISWRAHASPVLAAQYVDLDEAAGRLLEMFSLEAAEFFDDPYTSGQPPGPGRVLAFAPIAAEYLDVPFPTELVMPQEGVLALDNVDDATLRRWGLLGQAPASLAPQEQIFQTDDGAAGHLLDAATRRRIENHAQDALMRYYERRGYNVRDTRVGHPYDATATRGSRALYLEAKGTQSTRMVIDVTAGEVEHARAHPGECVLGIVTGIVVAADGGTSGGTLHIIDPWNPDDGRLTPTAYRHIPRAALHHDLPTESL